MHLEAFWSAIKRTENDTSNDFFMPPGVNPVDSQMPVMIFARRLIKHGVQPSVSRKGNCWDNAVTETLFASLKVERRLGERILTVRRNDSIGIPDLVGLLFVA
jgi:hypothetical protein